MILDTSALVAVLNAEAERRSFEELIAANDCSLSSVSYLEVSIVLSMKRGPEALHELDAWIETSEITVVPFTFVQARLARRAYLAYGKGRHKAGLNFGDCIAYALATDLSEPLLFKGDDLALTDVQSAKSIE